MSECRDFQPGATYTYSEALEIIDRVAKSDDEIISACNIDGICSDHMLDFHSAHQARISLEAINTVAVDLGKTVTFTIYWIG